jgi:hypothetical protein
MPSLSVLLPAQVQPYLVGNVACDLSLKRNNVAHFARIFSTPQMGVGTRLTNWAVTRTWEPERDRSFQNSIYGQPLAISGSVYVSFVSHYRGA